MTLPDSAHAQRDFLKVLLEASSLLVEAGSERELLSRTLDLAGTLLDADAYALWRELPSDPASADGPTWRRVAQRGLSGRYPVTVKPTPEHIPLEVWAIEDVLNDERVAFNRTVYETEGVKSALFIPWSMKNGINGSIIYHWHHPRRFSHEDITYAVALSNLSASALNRMELHEQHQRERGRLAFLSEASAVLSSSLDYGVTLERVAKLAVAGIAEWCTVYVVEDGIARRVAMAHADPAMADFAEEYERSYPEEITPEHGVGKVIATGEPEIVSPVTEAMIAAAIQGPDHLALLQQLKLSASIVAPLRSQGASLGAIRLLGTDGHHFDAGDLQLALDLGRRAAAAIENAQLHRALVEQTTELRLSHAAAKMGSWSWELERDALFWSPEFKALHNLPADVKPTSELSYALVHPEDRERARAEFWATLASSATTFQSEHRALLSDGHVLWLQVRGRIRRDADGKATWVAGLILDITESRLSEQALRRAEKLAAAGRLAATVAHEVNNPLASLVNLVYLAQRVEGLPEEAAAHLRVADDELARIAHIVRQTLGFYRESSSPRSTDIVALVQDVLDLYRSRCHSRGVILMAQPDGNASPQEVVATVIPGEIKQVVANLVANALDATPTGGSIAASVRRLDGTGAAEPGCVEIAIADTGHGIPEAIRGRLFEPFFTTKEDVGTGLGLWVSRGIAEKHGGTILLDTASASGTTFRVRLPLPH
jgi:PAS domain S-box-containing protein